MKDPLFTKILPDFRPIFCPIMADFCKFFQSWEGCSPPAPLSPTPMHSGILRIGLLKDWVPEIPDSFLGSQVWAKVAKVQIVGCPLGAKFYYLVPRGGG